MFSSVLRLVFVYGVASLILRFVIDEVSFFWRLSNVLLKDKPPTYLSPLIVGSKAKIVLAIIMLESLQNPESSLQKDFLTCTNRIT